MWKHQNDSWTKHPPISDDFCAHFKYNASSLFVHRWYAPTCSCRWPLWWVYRMMRALSWLNWLARSSFSMSLWLMRNYLNWRATDSTDLLKSSTTKDNGYQWVHVFWSYVFMCVKSGSLEIIQPDFVLLVSGPIRNNHHLCSLRLCQLQLIGHYDWRPMWVFRHCSTGQHWTESWRHVFRLPSKPLSVQPDEVRCRLWCLERCSLGPPCLLSTLVSQVKALEQKMQRLLFCCT